MRPNNRNSKLKKRLRMCLKPSYDIFMDESKGYQGSFQIFSIIFGRSSKLIALNDDLDQIMNGYGITGEFKSSNTSSKHLRCANDMLKLIVDYNKDKKTGIIVLLISKDKLLANAGFLQNTYRNMFVNNVNNKFHYTKLGIPLSDAAPLYMRAVHFLPFIYLRDNFGPERAKYNYYPDATGKVLNYEKHTLAIEGKKINYYILLKSLCNATIDFINLHQPPSWPTEKIYLAKFKPIDSRTDRRIQACDMISNYFLNCVRRNCGINMGIVKDKADIFEKHIDINGLNIDIAANFTKLTDSNGDEFAICISNNYAHSAKFPI